MTSPVHSNAGCAFGHDARNQEKPLKNSFVSTVAVCAGGIYPVEPPHTFGNSCAGNAAHCDEILKAIERNDGGECVRTSSRQ
jgi:hypothetical protein